MREMRREPEDPEARVPEVECLDGPARITSDELVITHFVKSGTLQNACSGIIRDNYPTRIDVPCVVQWSLLWFSAPTRLNKISGHYLKIIKYNEVVNSAIIDAVVRPFGGKRTPMSCMLTSVAREVGSKQGDGRMIRGSLAPSSSGDDDEDESGDE